MKATHLRPNAVCETRPERRPPVGAGDGDEGGDGRAHRGRPEPRHERGSSRSRSTQPAIQVEGRGSRQTETEEPRDDDGARTTAFVTRRAASGEALRDGPRHRRRADPGHQEEETDSARRHASPSVQVERGSPSEIHRLSRTLGTRRQRSGICCHLDEDGEEQQDGGENVDFDRDETIRADHQVVVVGAVEPLDQIAARAHRRLRHPRERDGRQLRVSPRSREARRSPDGDGVDRPLAEGSVRTREDARRLQQHGAEHRPPRPCPLAKAVRDLRQ